MDGGSSEPSGHLGADPPPQPPRGPGASPPGADYLPGGRRSLAGIALRAFGLGASLATSAGLVALLVARGGGGAPLWRLPFFLGALSLFHFLEFWATAAYNAPAAGVGSFLLTANWPAYPVAHAAASLECLLRTLLLPGPRLPPGAGPLLLGLGLALVAAGQAVRTAAMVQCGTSFNHVVQRRRGAAHALVTGGVYARLRHPSYFGFFWWALGTQLVLGNPLCLAAYAAVLWRFFSARIRHEEELLVRFFGDEYVRYRARTRTLIPFVP